MKREADQICEHVTKLSLHLKELTGECHTLQSNKSIELYLKTSILLVAAVGSYPVFAGVLRSPCGDARITITRGSR